MCAGGDEAAGEDEAKAAGFLDAEDLEAFRHPLADLGDELFAGEFARGLRTGVIALGHGHDEFEGDVPAEVEAGFVRGEDRPGQGLARGRHNGLVWGGGCGYGRECRVGVEHVLFVHISNQGGTEWCRRSTQHDI